MINNADQQHKFFNTDIETTHAQFKIYIQMMLTETLLFKAPIELYMRN